MSLTPTQKAAIRLLMTQPARVARWCGLERLTDGLHGQWLRQMICGQRDMTLLAHRGSCKTTCLAFAMTVLMILFPRRNLLFLRKTEDDVTEVIRQVKMLLLSDAMQYLSACIYGRPVAVIRTDMFSVHTSCFCAMRGAPQLRGLGTGGSLTGKHADVVITDDIVNLHDRTSAIERQRIRSVYQELQNILNPGGRFINTGTPWHPEDAISMMPNIRRYPCWDTGLLSPEEIRALQHSMEPSLFAANYELVHIAREDALFATEPGVITDATLLRDGFAHIDAAYGGSDFTALTCGRIADGRAYLYGRLWQKPANDVMADILAECQRLMCSPIYLETNGDRGFLARELRLHGQSVRAYAEQTNKHLKIATHLKKWWPRISFLTGTDRAYIRQILDYTEHAAHDDAPDSAASLLRVLSRRTST
ncbi:MAG: hypothetical protein IJE07_12145 [Clostridia bacterium]|nr:hypothetical protein [Clostridia bacterium]